MSRGREKAVEAGCEETFMSPQQSRVLIVDDNEMNRDMLARRLSRSGYLVDVAENARQLIQLVKEGFFLQKPFSRDTLVRKVAEALRNNAPGKSVQHSILS